MEIELYKHYVGNDGYVYHINAVTGEGLTIFGIELNQQFYRGKNGSVQVIFNKFGESISSNHNVTLVRETNPVSNELSAVDYLKLKIKKLEKEIKDLEGN